MSDKTKKLDLLGMLVAQSSASTEDFQEISGKITRVSEWTRDESNPERPRYLLNFTTNTGERFSRICFKNNFPLNQVPVVGSKGLPAVLTVRPNTYTNEAGEEVATVGIVSVAYDANDLGMGAIALMTGAVQVKM